MIVVCCGDLEAADYGTSTPSHDRQIKVKTDTDRFIFSTDRAAIALHNCLGDRQSEAYLLRPVELRPLADKGLKNILD